MAIYIITGKPGSGKSYFTVYHLTKKYFSFDDILKEYLPKGEFSVVTNIESLKVNTFDLKEMVKVAGGVNQFFNVEYQKQLLKRWNRIVYIIDEAGELFPKKFSDEKVIFFFQYHRHLGLDFYLITPSEENITRQITCLSEYTINARSRSARLLSSFVYDKLFTGEKAGTVSIPQKQEVFRLYKSMEKAEGEKISSFTRKYIIMAVLVACLSAVVFIGSLKYVTSRGKTVTVKDGKVHVEKDKRGQKPDSLKSQNKTVSNVPERVPLVEQSPKTSYQKIIVGNKGDAISKRVLGRALREGEAKDVKYKMFEVRVFGEGNESIIWDDSGKIYTLAEIPGLLEKGVKVGERLFIQGEDIDRVSRGGAGAGNSVAAIVRGPVRVR